MVPGWPSGSLSFQSLAGNGKSDNESLKTPTTDYECNGDFSPTTAYFLRFCGCGRITGAFMEQTSEERLSTEGESTRETGGRWKILWFLLHLAAVYAIVKFFTPWLAGWTQGMVLPLLLQHPISSSRVEFLYSHILVLSFIPAFFAGLINARFRHKAAQYVWLVPTVILAYKFVTFPASVLQSQFAAAFHQYFGGSFVIGEFRDWREFWNIVETNSDMMRGMAQMQYTAPFYAGAAYSVAAWIGRRTELNRKVADKVEAWERSRFGHQS